MNNTGWICVICGASNNPANSLCGATCWKVAQNKLATQGVYIPPIDGLPGSGGYAARPE